MTKVLLTNIKMHLIKHFVPDLYVHHTLSIYIARKTDWTMDYFRRLADTIANRNLLCRTSSLLENQITNYITTWEDMCHILKRGRLVKGLNHMSGGSNGKHNETHVRQFVELVNNFTDTVKKSYSWNVTTIASLPFRWWSD
eukprot:UN32398